MPDTEKVIYVKDLRQRIVEDKQIRGGAFAAVMRHLQTVQPAKPGTVCPCCGAVTESLKTKNS